MKLLVLKLFDVPLLQQYGPRAVDCSVVVITLPLDAGSQKRDRCIMRGVLLPRRVHGR